MTSVRSVLVAGAVLAVLAAAGPAQAAFSVTGFGGSATNPDGSRNAQAGAHPDVTTKIDFSTVERNGSIVADGNVKDLDVTLPAGLVGNPTVAPTCTLEQLKNNKPGLVNSFAICPVDTQVGVAEITLGVSGSPFPFEVGIFNVDAPRGVPALFGFTVFGVNVLLTPEVRGSDYGLNIHAIDTSQGLAILSSKITLWGVPADPVHDAQRTATARRPTTIRGTVGLAVEGVYDGADGLCGGSVDDIDAGAVLAGSGALEHGVVQHRLQR